MCKKFLSISIILLTIIPLRDSHAKELNILFIGNSFTFRHNLPELVKQVIEEGQKDTTVNVERIVYGGQDMFRHYSFYFSEAYIRMNTISVSEIEKRITLIKEQESMKMPPDSYINYWQEAGLKMSPWSEVRKNLKSANIKLQSLAKRIKRKDTKKWDYVVLQSWNDIVPKVDKGYSKYVQTFSKIANSQGAKIILYLTSPHSQNKVPVTEPRQLERTKKELGIARSLMKKVNAHAVIPVPQGIWKLQEKGSSILLRYKNDFHPNQYTAFLTANMFYTSLYKESTENFTFNSVTETKLINNKDPDGGEAKVVFNEEIKRTIQRAAFDAVMSFDKMNK